MIGTNNLGKSYGARALFEGVNLKLNAGSRYGLVGANGSGKTTFLKILAGDEPATEGSMSLPKEARTGVLRQDRFLRDDDIILEVTMMGDRLVWDALVEQRRIVEQGDGDAARLAEIEDLLRAHDGYTLEARATAILEGLGIPVAAHRRSLETLSGGFQLRVLLAQVLIGGPDVLLLDEPTNHLDILSIRWLEKFLIAYRGCALVISHDQRFLDNITSHILDVDYGTISLYVGNYAAFTVEKRAIRERKKAEIARAEEAIAHKQAYVDRFRYKASKARQAQSRLKQIERIEVEELADTSRRAPVLRFSVERPSGRDVLAIEAVSKAYGDKVVLRDVSLSVRRGERVAVIGPNGLGKSTLLRIAVDRLAADAGAVRWGHEARVGYFAQDHTELLPDGESKPLDFIWAACPDESPTYVRGQLGRVLFSGADVEKRVSALSGGEAARLVFCRLMVERPNVLVLDEPTNHLDVESITALVEGLKAYEGTVIFVSHDRWFVSELATRILEVTPTGPRDFPGTYDEYLARCGDDHLDADAVVLKAKKEREPLREAAPLAAAAASGASWEENKRKRNRQKELPARRDKVMEAIEAAEARKQAIVEMYCSPGFFERTAKEETAKLAAEQAELGARIETLMAEWEKLEAEIAEMGG
jgi:ATPase subunit of ABC transporter with duplicated ATPase domains